MSLSLDKIQQVKAREEPLPIVVRPAGGKLPFLSMHARRMDPMPIIAGRIDGFWGQNGFNDCSPSFLGVRSLL